MKTRLIICIVVALLAISVAAQAAITLYTPAAGDATYSWNSKYSETSYGVGENAMGIGLNNGGFYGNDYTVSIFEIPIIELTGKTLTSATLMVDSLGFSTGYYYGSASIGWLDTGTSTLTGDVGADKLGPASTSRPGGFTIYDSGSADTPGLKSFDVLTCVQTDLTAGRTFSTFVMSGSRDTYGSIRTAESGSGPRIVANVAGNNVPEPTTITVLGAGLASLLFRRRRRG
ncbi:MAG: PEP-CTERM sorting domain-containing protein [Armatimonadota bacterium]